MATNLSIDPKLLDEALVTGGLKTKKGTVNQALTEFIQRRRQRGVIELFGKLPRIKTMAIKRAAVANERGACRYLCLVLGFKRSHLKLSWSGTSKAKEALVNPSFRRRPDSMLLISLDPGWSLSWTPIQGRGDEIEVDQRFPNAL